MSMLKLSLGFILAFTIMSTFGKSIPNFAGPYQVVLHKFYNESDGYKSQGKLGGLVFFSPPKPRQRQYAWGRTFNDGAFDNNLRLEVRLSTRSNNEWKRNAFVMVFPNGCTEGLKQAPGIFRLFFAEDNLVCPIPAGKRDIVNQTVDARFPSFKIFPYGHYLVDILPYQGKNLVGSFAVDLEIRPKV